MPIINTLGFSAFVILSLVASNILFDMTRNFVWSRKLAHALVGLAIFATPWLFSTPLVPVVLAAVILVIFIATHRRELFYGVARRGRLSEIYFATSAGLCLASGWWVNPWIGIAAVLMMAWGDGITGLVRWMTDKRHAKTLSGTAANLVVCSLIAILVTPYWIGLAGALVGVVLEHVCGDVGEIKFLDDNLAMPLGALMVMVILQQVVT